MNERAKKRLRDARLACDRVIELAENETLETYAASDMRRWAIERQLEVIGEALGVAVREDDIVSRLIPETRFMVGLRNKISHGYDGISDEVVWDTVVTDIPVLLAKIEELLQAG